MANTHLKSSLRKAKRAARKSMSAADRSTFASGIVERALAIPEIANASHVMGYAATEEEFDPKPLLDVLRSRGAAIYLPRICGPGALSAHLCDPAVPLEVGPFDLLQPRSDMPTIDPFDCDLIIVPGVAFNARGARLGMGGGFYDRLLVNAPHAIRLALIFDSQLTEAIPEDEHDQPVDIIITPTVTLHTGARH